MKNSKENFEQLRIQASRQEEQPPAHVWKQLERRLEESGLRSPKVYRMHLPWKKIILAAGFASLLAVCLWFWYPVSTEQTNMAVVQLNGVEMQPQPSYIEDLEDDVNESKRMQREIRLLYNSYAKLN